MIDEPILRLVLSDLYIHDAIGNFALALADWARERAIACALYAERRSPSIPVDGDYAAFFQAVRAGDVLVYQLSNDDPALERLMAAPCFRVVYYHNITPGHFFRPYRPDIADMLDRGRAALSRLSGADAVFANSTWSLSEVTPFLRPETPRGVMPPLTESMFTSITAAPAPPLPQPYILTVGRVVPHKNISWGIRLFAGLKKRLLGLRYVIMGGDGGLEEYAEEARALASSLGEASVVFTGQTSSAESAAWFRGAVALLCASRHEGFGVPLVEAMHNDLPVLALDQPAVRETLGGTGLLLAGESPEVDAEQAADLLLDGRAIQSLLAKQRLRAAELREIIRNNPFWRFITPPQYNPKAETS